MENVGVFSVKQIGITENVLETFASDMLCEVDSIKQKFVSLFSHDKSGHDKAHEKHCRESKPDHDKSYDKCEHDKGWAKST
jgi:hypothetical protein